MGSNLLSTFRVLVVEDNLINQKVIRIILERFCFNYKVAGNGVDGLKLYQDEPFDLILMDCQMPYMDGLQTCTNIREFEQINGRSRCKIIAMTANAMEGDRERCLAVGMDEFLAKPFRSQDLIRILENWGFECLKK